MKTESHSINDVLAKNATSFFIPPFQRAYAWGKTEIDRYFFDVMRIVNSELDNSIQDKLEHFFGTLVIKEEKAGFANKSVIVDGQQRITTTLIFLIALRDLEEDAIKRDYITQNFLINNTSTFQDKIKLKQVTKDWEAYRALVNNEQPNPGIINNAHILFSKLINDVKSNNSDIKLEHFLVAIQRMNVAVIFLDERPFKGEDPQIIFETLNSLGKPLTLSDLVRNYVLLNMDSDNQSKIYEETWHPKIEAVFNEETSKFFRDYLQFKTISSIKVVSDNNTKELYQLFKNFVESEFETHSDFIKDIVRYVNWYKWIISELVYDTISLNDENNRTIKELLRNIFHDIKAEAFKPFVLGLLESHQDKNLAVRMSDETLIDALSTIRTYLIRRRILGLTQGENKNIVLLSERIDEIAKNNTSMVELLSDMFYRLRFPNDTEMRDELVTMNFYEGLKQYSKFILGKIEEHNTKVAVDFRNPKVTIEHIMPQKLNEAWEIELGENFNEIHKKHLHTIGNLILTEFNSEIGNKPFFEKKLKINTSSLYYRLDIIEREYWNENSIIEHQNNMINWFLETFSLPDDYKDNNNWSSARISTNSFSPLDEDAGEIAEGSRPVEIQIENSTSKVKTWQDVLIKFILHVKDNPNFDFDIIRDNQQELFRREDTIVSWARLQQIIEENIDLTYRYKTFDGKFWDKVKNLSDETLFIHTNISANTCINRIVNIMNKFSIPEDYVNISIK